MKVLLIGDSCLDEYHYGVCERISPEAPVPVFKFIEKQLKYGMASNVYSNLLSFNLNVEFITNDPHLIIKKRFIDNKSKQMLLREDIEQNIPFISLREINNDYDACVISDYNKGSINYDELKVFLNKFNKPIFVDTKNPNLKYYDNCIIKINNYETEKIYNIPQNCQIITTVGKDGAIWNDKKILAPEVEVFDVTGAGDVFLSALCFFYLAYNNLDIAIKAAVFLASKSVQHRGIYILTEGDIRECLSFINE